MFEIVNGWLKRYFSDPQAIYLAALLLLGFSVVIFAGSMLLPVIAGIVIAYLLEGFVQYLESKGSKRFMAVMLVFSVFIALLVFLLFGLVPLMARQVGEFLRQLPEMISRGEQALLQLPDVYPFISEKQIDELMNAIRSEVAIVGQSVLTQSLASLTSLITLTVYLVLMPLLVFFFLKDKFAILRWFDSFLPRQRSLMVRVWEEMDTQLGNYVRGKIWEIIVVGGVSIVVFAAFGLQYSVLLGALVGLSVVVPYVGAVAVTIPVALVAFFQWGWGADFAYLVTAYLVIQALDANILVPLLFSEVVNLHPIGIIVAVLFFGGLWGFWGVFFAIPLATLVQALLRAWPRTMPQVSSE